MDDLTANLNRILSDPQSMAQIQNMMQSMGIGSPDGTNSTENNNGNGGSNNGNSGSNGGNFGNNNGNNTADNTGGNSLGSLLNGLSGITGTQKDSFSANSQSGGSFSPANLTSALGPLMGIMGQEDDSTRLLAALKPLLSPPRQKKIDEAMKMLRMIKMLPLLRSSGLLDSIFGA